jgi:colicin import membrane protein
MHAIEARERRQAFGAALLMHGLLAAGLLVSLRFSQQPPPVVQVELWGGAPADRPSLPAPQPAAMPAPRSTPAAPPPMPKADIALEKKPQTTTPKADENAKREAARKDLERKAAAEQAAQKKLAEQKAAQQREAIRKAELARLLAGDTNTNSKPRDQGKDSATKAGASQGAEVGAKTGADPSFLQLVEAKIKNRINFNPSTVRGNPLVEFEIEQLPTGEIVRVTKVKSSGVLSWDAAVERAIWDSTPLPKPKNGPVPRIFDYRAGPNELR